MHRGLRRWSRKWRRGAPMTRRVGDGGRRGRWVVGALRDALQELPQSSGGFAAAWVGKDSSYRLVSMDFVKRVKRKTYR